MKIQIDFEHSLSKERFHIIADVPESVVKGFAQANGLKEMDFSIEDSEGNVKNYQLLSMELMHGGSGYGELKQ
jgi:hypothetical protein